MFPKFSTSGAEKPKLSTTQRMGSFQSTDVSSNANMQFGKTPSSFKGKLNLSFDANNPELTYTPRTPSMAYNYSPEGSLNNKSRNDSEMGTSQMISQNTVSVIELEFEVSSLKSQNKLMKEEYQTTITKISAEKETQFEELTKRMEQANETARKDKLKADTFETTAHTLTSQNRELFLRIQTYSLMIMDTTRRLEQNTKQLEFFKQESRKNRIELTEVTNQKNYLETELSSVCSKLNYSEERMRDLEGKEGKWKDMIMTMSQEKTLLNNRISQILEQQAKLENAEVMNKLYPGKKQVSQPVEDPRVKEMAKQIENLKNRITEILNQQETNNLKMIYEQKMQSMEKEIQQLKLRYQSPETIPIPQDKNEQQSKQIIQEKGREILQLSITINNMQNKINQLNREVESERSKKPAIPGKTNEVELNNLKTEVLNQKRALEQGDQKVKYLIAESRKKDDFLKQYLTTSTNKGKEESSVEEFFKKYSYEIPSDGFSHLAMKNAQTIHTLEEKVQSLTNRLYERR